MTRTDAETLADAEALADRFRAALLTVAGKLSALADADSDDAEMHIRADMAATVDAALAWTPPRRAA